MAKQYVLPGQPTRYARSRPFQIIHTKLEVELDFVNKSMRGRVTHSIRPSGAAPLNYIELDAAEMDFLSVKLQGKIARYSTSQNSITIFFEQQVNPGSIADIEIEYTTTPKKGLYFRGPTNQHPTRFVHAFTQGQAEDSKYWFPCYDYPNMRNTSEVTVKAPAKMTVVSNGRLVSVEQTTDGKNKVWRFKQEVSHSSYLLSLIVAEYEKLQEEYDDILLEYYVPQDRKNDALRSFGKTPKMMDFFKSVTGAKYPYPKYSQAVVSDYMFGGMENISATTLTEKTLHDDRSHLDFTSDNLVSHELAHQWFGDLITCKDWSHAWLNEGFATYFNALFREFDEGVDDYQYYMNGLKETLNDEIDDHYHRAIVEKRYWDPEERFDSHTYEKGAWVLNALRGYVGEENFSRGIRHYVATHKGTLVETSEFRKAMEEASGIDLESFFDQWLFSPGYPEYEAKYAWDENEKTVRLEVQQTNAGNDSISLFNSHPLDVRFTLADRSMVTKKVTMNSKTSTFAFALNTQPANVNIDPKNWVLKKLKFHKPREMFLYQLKNDENSMERVRAAEELVQFKSDDVIGALSYSIDNDPFWGVRLESASNLGRIGTKKALDYLLSKRMSKDHKVRRGVAIGLKNFAGLGEEDSNSAIDALVDFVNNDHSYYVRAYAAESLGSYKKSDRAFEAIKSALGQDSISDQVRYRSFKGLAEKQEDPRGLDLAIDHLKNGKEFQGRNGAVMTIGKLGRGKPEALEALLSAGRNEPDVRVRSSVAFSVHRLGDIGTIASLKEWLVSEPLGKVRRNLRESIFLLQEGESAKAEITKLRDDLGKLAEENKRLNERISSQEGISNQ